MKLRFTISFIVTIVLSFILLGASAVASEAQQGTKIGVGYQNMWIGGSMHGISGRVWLQNNFGFEGNLFMGDIEVTFKEEMYTDFYYEEVSVTSDADLFIMEIKGMYAPIVRENSRLYFGALLNHASFEVGGSANGIGDSYSDSVFGFGILMGSEWHFQGIPELGFNFDVGYKLYSHDDEIEIDINGIDATFGIKYYFN